MHAFRDVEAAAYCPRKLYYRQRAPEEAEIPDIVGERRRLAFTYEQLLTDDDAIRDAPIEPTETQYRSNLGCVRARLRRWEELADPADSDVFLSGRDCRGIAHKVLESPPTVSLAFAGEPPQEGVWQPQSVRLVAATKALAWERERSIESAFAEYPAYGIVRKIDVDARRTAAYREAVRIADAIDGPPARTNSSSKCKPCEYRPQCGVQTRSLRSLLGS